MIRRRKRNLQLGRDLNYWVLLIGSVMVGFPAFAEGEALDAEEIVRRAHATAQNKEKQKSVYTFLREVVLSDVDSKGRTSKKQTKTFRAYTNEREQELLTVNGRQATPEEIQKERERSRKQKRRFLNADPMNPAATGGRKENLMDRNITLFRDKFQPRLLGEESVRNRPAYVLDLEPDKDFRISHRIVDRIFNQLSLKVWIDQEDYEVAKLEAKLQDDVTFLGGIGGAVKDIKITVDQARLGANQWVDQAVQAFFDARVLWKSYHFGMQSESEDFRLVE